MGAKGAAQAAAHVPDHEAHGDDQRVEQVADEGLIGVCFVLRN